MVETRRGPIKLLGYLLEPKGYRGSLLPHQVRAREEVWLNAFFWCTDLEPHVLTVIARGPDDTPSTVATLIGTADLVPGVLVLHAPLDAFETPGWYRLHLQIDGELIAHSLQLQLVSPSRPRSARGRYKGRADHVAADPEHPEVEKAPTGPIGRDGMARPPRSPR